VSRRARAPRLEDYVRGVLARERPMLARAITLVESSRSDHQRMAQDLITELLPHAGKAHRVGITGVPGAGKSTFIDELGMRLVTQGKHVAVLAVDPSSVRSGGSILGDKTRMERLSAHPDAYIRPSPTAGSLGGVARSTRQAIVVVEAAGFDAVLVETVGVGQSETTVAQMVDTFLLLMLGRTGDSLQGIKRGVLELADVIAVNKADGRGKIEAQRAASELASAIRMLEPQSPNWRPSVLTCSGLEGQGVDEVWAKVEAHRACLAASGELGEKRLAQEVAWMWSMVQERIDRELRRHPALQARARQMHEKLRAHATTAARAAEELLDALDWFQDDSDDQRFQNDSEA